MKNQSNLCKLLGLSQMEAALLLGVHRSQLSMFESGKRSLPQAATLRLAEILKQNKPIEPYSAKRNAEITIERKRQLELRRVENEIQQFKVQRKMEPITRKYDAAIRAAALADSLQKDDSRSTARAAADSINAKSGGGARQRILPELVSLQVKLELLVQEHNTILSLLEEIRKRKIE